MTLGREKLAGVGRKLTVLSPEMTGAVMEEDDGGIKASYDRMSDAERLMLLRRDARKPQHSVPVKGSFNEPSEMQHLTITSFCEHPDNLPVWEAPPGG